MQENKKQNEESNIYRVATGMHTDFSPDVQPAGTLRFALNAVGETESGDYNALSNEMSTVHGFAFSSVPLSKVYIENGKSVIFSVSDDESSSKIGIKTGDTYQALVDADLGFKLTSQIQARYRLRRGCERTIYWTQKGKPPRLFNIDRPDNFKTGGVWDVNKFNLFRTYNLVPEFEAITINENGALPAGSYNAAIQYLDEDLNPTECIITSDPIIIYHKKYSDNFYEIRGTTNKETSYQSFGITGKSIDFEFGNLDTAFPFYRVVIIEANSGTGKVTRVTASDPISTINTKYTYTGSNNTTILTEEEVIIGKQPITSAEFLEQLDNRLLLLNTKGPQIDLCKLQKYASQIYAEGVTKTITLDDIQDTSCPKRGTVYFDNSVGNQPGEIYSYGIVYVCKNGFVTPTYHIPGRASNDVWTEPILGDFPMNNTNNALASATYTQAGNCSPDYWGVDYNGNPLADQPVRHHRFPSRAEANQTLDVDMKLINKTDTPTMSLGYTVYLSIRNLTEDTICENVHVHYTLDGEDCDTEGLICVGANSTYIWTIASTHSVISDVIVDVETFTDIFNTHPYLEPPSTPFATSDIIKPKDLDYQLHGPEAWINDYEREMKSDIMGIVFENIIKPQEWDGTENEIIGYYIVRHERTEEQKTILDTVALRCMFDQGNFIAYNNSLGTGLATSKRVFAFISPEHLFRGTQYSQIDEVEVINERLVLSPSHDTDKGFYATETTEDVMPGTSYDPKVAKRKVDGEDNADYDGFDLHLVSVFSAVQAEIESAWTMDDISEVFYLDALSYKIKEVDGITANIYNATSDNRIGIIITNGDHIDNISGAVRIGILKRNLADPYGNFRYLPYYKESPNMMPFDSDVEDTGEMYHGDVFTGTMNYNATTYYNTALSTEREVKRGLWKTILGVVLVVVGAVVSVLAAIYTAGAAVPLGVAIMKMGVAMTSSGITQAKLSKAYLEDYDAGLRDAIADSYINGQFTSHTDDEIQFFNYAIKDLYFESQVNVNLRVGSSGSIPDFINSYNKNYSTGEMLQYQLEKLTTLDESQHDGRLFQGFTAAEYYEINPDYYRGNKQKIFYHLPLEYDCCSACPECFSTRIFYSEQSFQEELTDNYRTFLANNYRDLQGETGAITNVFSINSRLYLHTEEALWMLAQNYQEKLIGDVVSYVGSGEFFDIPPKRIVDADGNSGGSTHPEATIKTEFGIFFVSAKERKIYHFNGETLTAISNYGRKAWFDKNIPFEYFDDSYVLNYLEYDDPNKDLLNNPSNPIGMGFIAAYDKKRKRVLFTKKEYVPYDGHATPASHPKYLYANGYVYRFNNYQDTINDRRADGWTFTRFVYLADVMQMEFKKLVDGSIETDYETSTEIGTVASFIGADKSWTTSYSLKEERKGWLSMHSYLPSFYIDDGDDLYSWKEGRGNYIWKHYNQNGFLSFYGTAAPFILEFAIPARNFNAEIWEDIQFYTEAKTYGSSAKEWMENRFVTFNKIMFYNTRQCSGELTMQTKASLLGTNYMSSQVKRTSMDTITIDKNEKFWSVNQIRDMVVDYTEPLFSTDIDDLQDEYYIDKIINENVIDFEKSWSQLESFRDKYLIVRLKFSTFENVKLIFNYLKVDGKNSER